MLADIDKAGYVKQFGEKYKIDISGNQLAADSVDLPLVETDEVVMTDRVQANGDKLYFNPFLFFRVDTNPFPAYKRNYPLDFGYGEEYIFTATIKLPDDYQVEEMPSGKVLALPGMLHLIMSIASIGMIN